MGLLRPLLLSLVASLALVHAAEVVPLGAGSYLRGLPDGAKGPPVAPFVTAEVRREHAIARFHQRRRNVVPHANVVGKTMQQNDGEAVAWTAIDAAVARGVDVAIIDTAGRLHTSDALMDELRKVVRVIDKRLPGAPHEALLVLDATIGQNAVAQARVFAASVPVTGLVLTKLDGTAKGGVVVAVHEAINAPVKFVGVGEAADDLEPFDADAFAQGLFSE